MLIWSHQNFSFCVFHWINLWVIQRRNFWLLTRSDHLSSKWINHLDVIIGITWARILITLHELLKFLEEVLVSLKVISDDLIFLFLGKLENGRDVFGGQIGHQPIWVHKEVFVHNVEQMDLLREKLLGVIALHLFYLYLKIPLFIGVKIFLYKYP